VKPRVFLVEDDPDMREVTGLLLKGPVIALMKRDRPRKPWPPSAGPCRTCWFRTFSFRDFRGQALPDPAWRAPHSSLAHHPSDRLKAHPRQSHGTSGRGRRLRDQTLRTARIPRAVEALLRRAQRAGAPAEIMECKGLKVDLASRKTTVDGQDLDLPHKEFELLVTFLRHPGQLLTRPRLARVLWEDDVIVTNNTLTVHIKNLRALLGLYGKCIRTLVHEGYRFDLPE